MGDVPAVWTRNTAIISAFRRTMTPKVVFRTFIGAPGLVGYFPTYTLGNVYAAQFYAQAVHDPGDLSTTFSHGDFSPLLAWLREKIHRHGQHYRATTLCVASPAVLPITARSSTHCARSSPLCTTYK